MRVQLEIDLNIACIVLAAGKSRRFGGQKLLHTITSDMPMLSATLLPYCVEFEQVNVVTCVDNVDIAHLAQRYAANVVTIESNAGGLSQSIIAGIKAVPDADAWLIALGDMPYINIGTIRQLKYAMRDNKIVIPRYADQLGNPVGFGRQFKEQLLQLQGDVGAKPLIEQLADHVVYVDTNDDGILHDIDVPEAIR